MGMSGQARERDAASVCGYAGMRLLQWRSSGPGPRRSSSAHAQEKLALPAAAASFAFLCAHSPGRHRQYSLFAHEGTTFVAASLALQLHFPIIYTCMGIES
jgi:hypothetical protein